MRSITDLIKQYRHLVYLLLTSLSLILFTYLTPPIVSDDLAARLPLLKGLPGDLPVYGLRFFLSFILLGLIPLTTVLLLGENLGSIGLKKPHSRFSVKAVFLTIIACLAVGIFSAYSPEIYSYYPYSRTLLNLIADRGFSIFLLHALLYLLLFHLPWELLFRGILIFPFLRLVGKEQNRAIFLIIASFQIFPSTLLHFGHPILETLGAIPFGFLAGYLALKTGSILPALFIHSLIGISTDLFITLRFLDILP